MKKSEKKTLFRYTIILVVVLLVVGVVLLYANKVSEPAETLRERVLLIAENIDISNSPFSSEETPVVLQQFNDILEEIRSNLEPDVIKVVDLGRKAKILGDYDTALALFAIVDTMNPQDLFYLIDKGQIYLDREQWMEAATVFEPMRITWPIRETYLGLGEAYQHIEGTADYIIDGIYEEGIEINFREFAILRAYAEWLEDSGREQKALPLYKEMQEQNPQPSLEQKIKELESKYPSNK